MPMNEDGSNLRVQPIHKLSLFGLILDKLKLQGDHDFDKLLQSLLLCRLDNLAIDLWTTVGLVRKETQR